MRCLGQVRIDFAPQYFAVAPLYCAPNYNMVIQVTNLFILVISLSFATTAFGAEKKITLNTSQPLPPLQSNVIYNIKCPAHHYIITISSQQKDVKFQVDNNVFDDYSTHSDPLFQMISSNELFGRYGFSCSAKGLGLTFVGFNIATTPTTPVEFQAVIGNDGKVLMNTGIHSSNLLFIQQLWSNTHQRP